MGNTENADQKQEIMTGKEYRSIFWRSFTIQSSWSFDKMMAYGYRSEEHMSELQSRE